MYQDLKPDSLKLALEGVDLTAKDAHLQVAEKYLDIQELLPRVEEAVRLLVEKGRADKVVGSFTKKITEV